MSISPHSGQPPVLRVKDLQVSYRTQHRWQQAIHGISFDIQPGELVALVGESGSGKTTTAQAVIGLLADNARRDSGTISLNGETISNWSKRRMNHIRGKRISLVPQDPANSLDPLKTIGQQVGEILLLHSRVGRNARRQRVVELLERVGISHPEARVNQYPHQLSGGMKQRVLIAIAVALKPDLIIADEPTSALDVTVQKRILDILDSLRQESNTAVLFVTHDLALAAERVDRILVFKDGRIREEAPTQELVAAPREPYTQQLLRDAAPKRHQRTKVLLERDVEPVIKVSHVSKRFSLSSKQSFHALDEVGFSVLPGTTHALVGESGSGKTTLARILLGFEQPDNGEISIAGIQAQGLRGNALRELRRKIQFVYQNPFGSLDPRQKLFDVIAEPLRNYEKLSRTVLRQRVEAIATRVALAPEFLSRRARELSGGQRQRVALARALVLRPDILVLDEATSALDVTVQAQIIDLLHELQRDLGVTYLFITHDLATVRDIANSLTVLRAGKVIEQGSVEEVFDHPASAYTRELIDAIPRFPSFATTV